MNIAHPNLCSTDRPASSGWLPVALGVLLLSACNGEPDWPEAQDPSVRPVRVGEVVQADEPGRLRLPGVTRAVERADLAFLHAGHLAERGVMRGDIVQAGQTLAILHNPSLMPGVAAAEARVRELDEQLEQLERDTRRLEDLHQRGLIATDELDRVRARRNAVREGRGQAKAQLDEARDQLQEATLRAPFSARVVELHAEPGQFVAAGQAIVSIAAADHLEVPLDISARHAGRLQAGDDMPVRQLDGAGMVMGRIREIGLSAPGRPATLVMDLPRDLAPEWVPGQAVHVELGWAGEGGLSVPLAALVDTGSGISRLFRVRDGRADSVEVIPGALHQGRVRVQGDLAPGDRVVIAGHGQLLDGERVRVLP